MALKHFAPSLVAGARGYMRGKQQRQQQEAQNKWRVWEAQRRLALDAMRQEAHRWAGERHGFQMKALPEQLGFQRQAAGRAAELHPLAVQGAELGISGAEQAQEISAAQEGRAAKLFPSQQQAAELAVQRAGLGLELDRLNIAIKGVQAKGAQAKYDLEMDGLRAGLQSAKSLDEFRQLQIKGQALENKLASEFSRQERTTRLRLQEAQIGASRRVGRGGGRAGVAEAPLSTSQQLLRLKYLKGQEASITERMRDLDREITNIERGLVATGMSRLWLPEDKTAALISQRRLERSVLAGELALVQQERARYEAQFGGVIPGTPSLRGKPQTKGKDDPALVAELQRLGRDKNISGTQVAQTLREDYSDAAVRRLMNTYFWAARGVKPGSHFKKGKTGK